MYIISNLVSTEGLAEQLGRDDLVIVDVRWTLNDPVGGRRAFQEAHLPGAIFLDLDTELSDRSDLRRGRHPLPDPRQFVELLTRKGIGRDSSVVAYDASGGDVAARLWWMLRWVGLNRAAVLDGGFAKWVAEGWPVESGAGRKLYPAAAPLPPVFNVEKVARRVEILPAVARRVLLLDARSAERFRGENETIDKRAGHIPGAISAPWADNMIPGEIPVFKSPAELRARFSRLGVTPDSEVISYCGSGVTACHNLLALELAGFSRARLYPGSWSEWIEN